MIDKTYLKPGYTQNKDNGYYADFYDNGKLKEFAYYKDGNADNWWVLTLDKDADSGRATLKNGSGGSSDWETYFNGESEHFDAWSDNSKPQKISYSEWVKNWITRIYSINNHD